MPEPELTPDQARRECYQRLRVSMNSGVKAYYKKHPERLDDARSQDAITYSLHGLKHLLEILDEYEITKKKLNTP